MKRTLSILCLAFATLAACGDDAQSSSDEGYCLIGEEGCSCDLNGGCEGDGIACVAGICEECPTGEEGCPCGVEDACEAELACIDPDPECTFNCEPMTCEAD